MAEDDLRKHAHLSNSLLQKHGFQANTVIDIGAAEGAFFVLRDKANLICSRHMNRPNQLLNVDAREETARAS